MPLMAHCAGQQPTAESLKQPATVEQHRCYVEGEGRNMVNSQQDHIADKGYNCVYHYVLVHTLVPVSRAMKQPLTTSTGRDAQKAALPCGRSCERRSVQKIPHQPITYMWCCTLRAATIDEENGRWIVFRPLEDQLHGRSVVDRLDLLRVQLRNDNVPSFETRWDETVIATRKQLDKPIRSTRCLLCENKTQFQKSEEKTLQSSIKKRVRSILSTEDMRNMCLLDNV